MNSRTIPQVSLASTPNPSMDVYHAQGIFKRITQIVVHPLNFTTISGPGLRSDREEDQLTKGYFLVPGDPTPMEIDGGSVVLMKAEEGDKPSEGEKKITPPDVNPKDTSFDEVVGTGLPHDDLYYLLHYLSIPVPSKMDDKEKEDFRNKQLQSVSQRLDNLGVRQGRGQERSRLELAKEMLNYVQDRAKGEHSAPLEVNDDLTYILKQAPKIQRKRMVSGVYPHESFYHVPTEAEEEKQKKQEDIKKLNEEKSDWSRRSDAARMVREQGYYEAKIPKHPKLGYSPAEVFKEKHGDWTTEKSPDGKTMRFTPPKNLDLDKFVGPKPEGVAEDTEPKMTRMAEAMKTAGITPGEKKTSSDFSTLLEDPELEAAFKESFKNRFWHPDFYHEFLKNPSGGVMKDLREQVENELIDKNPKYEHEYRLKQEKLKRYDDAIDKANEAWKKEGKAEETVKEFENRLPDFKEKIKEMEKLSEADSNKKWEESLKGGGATPAINPKPAGGKKDPETGKEPATAGVSGKSPNDYDTLGDIEVALQEDEKLSDADRKALQSFVDKVHSRAKASLKKDDTKADELGRQMGLFEAYKDQSKDDPGIAVDKVKWEPNVKKEQKVERKVADLGGLENINLDDLESLVEQEFAGKETEEEKPKPAEPSTAKPAEEPKAAEPKPAEPKAATAGAAGAQPSVRPKVVKRGGQAVESAVNNVLKQYVADNPDAEKFVNALSDEHRAKLNKYMQARDLGEQRAIGRDLITSLQQAKEGSPLKDPDAMSNLMVHLESQREKVEGKLRTVVPPKTPEQKGAPAGGAAATAAQPEAETQAPVTGGAAEAAPTEKPQEASKKRDFGDMGTFRKLDADDLAELKNQGIPEEYHNLLRMASLQPSPDMTTAERSVFEQKKKFALSQEARKQGITGKSEFEELMGKNPLPAEIAPSKNISFPEEVEKTYEERGSKPVEEKEKKDLLKEYQEKAKEAAAKTETAETPEYLKRMMEAAKTSGEGAEPIGGPKPKAEEKEKVEVKIDPLNNIARRTKREDVKSFIEGLPPLTEEQNKLLEGEKDKYQKLGLSKDEASAMMRLHSSKDTPENRQIRTEVINTLRNNLTTDTRSKDDLFHLGRSLGKIGQGAPPPKAGAPTAEGAKPPVEPKKTEAPPAEEPPGEEPPEEPKAALTEEVPTEPKATLAKEPPVEEPPAGEPPSTEEGVIPEKVAGKQRRGRRGKGRGKGKGTPRVSVGAKDQEKGAAKPPTPAGSEEPPEGLGEEPSAVTATAAKQVKPEEEKTAGGFSFEKEFPLTSFMNQKIRQKPKEGFGGEGRHEYVPTVTEMMEHADFKGSFPNLKSNKDVADAIKEEHGRLNKWQQEIRKVFKNIKSEKRRQEALEEIAQPYKQIYPGITTADASSFESFIASQLTDSGGTTTPEDVKGWFSEDALENAKKAARKELSGEVEPTEEPPVIGETTPPAKKTKAKPKPTEEELAADAERVGKERDKELKSVKKRTQQLTEEGNDPADAERLANEELAKQKREEMPEGLNAENPEDIAQHAMDSAKNTDDQDVALEQMLHGMSEEEQAKAREALDAKRKAAEAGPAEEPVVPPIKGAETKEVTPEVVKETTGTEAAPKGKEPEKKVQRPGEPAVSVQAPGEPMTPEEEAQYRLPTPEEMREMPPGAESAPEADTSAAERAEGPPGGTPKAVAVRRPLLTRMWNAIKNFFGGRKKATEQKQDYNRRTAARAYRSGARIGGGLGHALAADDGGQSLMQWTGDVSTSAIARILEGRLRAAMRAAREGRPVPSPQAMASDIAAEATAAHAAEEARKEGNEEAAKMIETQAAAGKYPKEVVKELNLPEENTLTDEEEKALQDQASQLTPEEHKKLVDEHLGELKTNEELSPEARAMLGDEVVDNLEEAARNPGLFRRLGEAMGLVGKDWEREAQNLGFTDEEQRQWKEMQAPGWGTVAEPEPEIAEPTMAGTGAPPEEALQFEQPTILPPAGSSVPSPAEHAELMETVGRAGEKQAMEEEPLVGGGAASFEREKAARAAEAQQRAAREAFEREPELSPTAMNPPTEVAGRQFGAAAQTAAYPAFQAPAETETVPPPAEPEAAPPVKEPAGGWKEPVNLEEVRAMLQGQQMPPVAASKEELGKETEALGKVAPGAGTQEEIPPPVPKEDLEELTTDLGVHGGIGKLGEPSIAREEKPKAFLGAGAKEKLEAERRAKEPAKTGPYANLDEYLETKIPYTAPENFDEEAFPNARAMAKQWIAEYTMAPEGLQKDQLWEMISDAAKDVRSGGKIEGGPNPERGSLGEFEWNLGHHLNQMMGPQSREKMNEDVRSQVNRQYAGIRENLAKQGVASPEPTPSPTTEVKPEEGGLRLPPPVSAGAQQRAGEKPVPTMPSAFTEKPEPLLPRMAEATKETPPAEEELQFTEPEMLPKTAKAPAEEELQFTEPEMLPKRKQMAPGRPEEELQFAEPEMLPKTAKAPAEEELQFTEPEMLPKAESKTEAAPQIIGKEGKTPVPKTVEELQRVPQRAEPEVGALEAEFGPALEETVPTRPTPRGALAKEGEIPIEEPTFAPPAAKEVAPEEKKQVITPAAPPERRRLMAPGGTAEDVEFAEPEMLPRATKTPEAEPKIIGGLQRVPQRVKPEARALETEFGPALGEKVSTKTTPRGALTEEGEVPIEEPAFAPPAVKEAAPEREPELEMAPPEMLGKEGTAPIPKKYGEFVRMKQALREGAAPESREKMTGVAPVEGLQRVPQRAKPEAGVLETEFGPALGGTQPVAKVPGTKPQLGAAPEQELELEMGAPEVVGRAGEAPTPQKYGEWFSRMRQAKEQGGEPGVGVTKFGQREFAPTSPETIKPPEMPTEATETSRVGEEIPSYANIGQREAKPREAPEQWRQAGYTEPMRYKLRQTEGPEEGRAYATPGAPAPAVDVPKESYMQAPGEPTPTTTPEKPSTTMQTSGTPPIESQTGPEFSAGSATMGGGAPKEGLHVEQAPPPTPSSETITTSAGETSSTPTSKPRTQELKASLGFVILLRK